MGGTVANTVWRKFIEDNINTDSFNPVVKDWTEKCRLIENDEKENHCNIHLYVITSEILGYYSIAEAIDSVHNKKVTTILQIIPKGFSEAQLHSLRAVAKLVKERGGVSYVNSDLNLSVQAINSIPENKF